MAPNSESLPLPTVAIVVITASLARTSRFVVTKNAPTKSTSRESLKARKQSTTFHCFQRAARTYHILQKHAFYRRAERVTVPAPSNLAWVAGTTTVAEATAAAVMRVTHTRS